MQPAAYAGLLGNASLLTATYGKICVELNCAAIRCASRVPDRVKWRSDHDNDNPGLE